MAASDGRLQEELRGKAQLPAEARKDNQTFWKEGPEDIPWEYPL